MDEEQGDQQRPTPSWAPPDAGARPDAAVGRPPTSPPPPSPGLVPGGGPDGAGAPTWTWGPPDADADGPPPPPWERRRRTRRRWAIGLTAAVVLAIPVGLGIASALSTPSTPAADDEAAQDDRAAGEPGPGPDQDGGSDELDAPDLDRLEGHDLIFAQLLLDIDTSEQAMLGFQRELAELFSSQGPGDQPAALFQAVAAAGADGAERLEEARAALEEPLADVRAEAVREVYLDHLDSWLRYLRAVEEDPLIIGRDEGEATARYTLSINATADAFARELVDQLPDDADPEVQRMVEQLLDRGFRPQGDANV